MSYIVNLDVLDARFTTQINGADMNEIKKNGFYTIVSALNEPPFSSTFVLIVAGNNGDYCVQIACAFQNDDIKIRRCLANSWYGWRKITLA